MAFTYVTITETFETAGDLPARGTVEFTPVAQMHNGIAVVAAPEVATLDTAGSIARRLAATTDPGTTPPGVTYKVVEKIVGQPTQTYFKAIPHNQGATLQLSSLPPVASGTAAGFALRAAVDYDDSVAPSDGQVMTWDGTTSKFHPEAAGAGGAVSSVNGATGAVTITASGLGAQPIDSDLTAFAALAPADGSLLGRQAGAWAGRSPSQAKADLGLDQVDNTSDTTKPVSTATATALAAKAPLASPAFTGTPTGPRFVGAVQTVTYAASITLDAAVATSFRVPSATGDITTVTINNGTAGQIIYLRVQASGADRAVTVAGSTVTVTSATWRIMMLAYDQPTSAWQLQSVTSAGGGGTPDDGSVTNAKVAVTAAIDLDKTADSASRLAMTTAERAKLAGIATAATAYTDELAQDAAAAAFAAGSHSGITFTYNDPSNSISAAVTGGGSVNLADTPNLTCVVAYTSTAQVRPQWRGPVIWQGDVTGLGIPTNMVPGKDWTQDFGARTDGARYFDGVSPNYAFAADSTSLRSPSTAVTLAGFWRPSTYTATDGGLWGKVGTLASRSMSYAVIRRDTTDARNLRFRLGLSTAGNVLIDPANMATTLAMDTWYFLACTWASGAAPRLRVWTPSGTSLIDSTGGTSYTDSIIYGADQFRVGKNDQTDTTGVHRVSLAAIGVHNAVVSDANLTLWRTNKVPPITLSGGFWALNGASTASEPDTAQTNTLSLSGIVHTTGGP